MAVRAGVLCRTVVQPQMAADMMARHPKPIAFLVLLYTVACKVVFKADSRAALVPCVRESRAAKYPQRKPLERLPFARNGDGEMENRFSGNLHDALLCLVASCKRTPLKEVFFCWQTPKTPLARFALNLVP